jgi:zinc protease
MKQGCEQVEARSRVLAPMVADAIGEAIFPAGECRARPMRSEQGARITVDAAQQWLERHITSSPVEVSIVGDLTLEEAMRLGAGYLGRLPPRDRPGPEHFADARRIPRPAYPIRAEVVRDIDPGAAIVVAGFPGADAPDTRALRTLRVAARVLDQRATDALQDAGFEEVEVGCAAMAGTIYPGFGVVVANVKVDAARAEQAADVIEGVIHHMAADGVSAPEVAQAAQELTRVVERYEKEPQYWASILARAESTGLDPDLVAEGANFYRGITAEAVSDTVRRSVGQGRTLRLIIRGSTPGVEAGGK